MYYIFVVDASTIIKYYLSICYNIQHTKYDEKWEISSHGEFSRKGIGSKRVLYATAQIIDRKNHFQV